MSAAQPQSHPTLALSPVAASVSAVTAMPLSMAEVVGHRAYLVRFAMRRLRDPMLAEDAVHDVFEAVLSGRASFGGRAALRSWLTAVLKNKIVDAVRRAPRHDSLDAEDDEGKALSLIHISEPTRRTPISYAVFCLK